ncbi:hypothetical protein [Stenotrophomonas acidaminiphila]|uniref:hypothetical protein n=1 Tax=Stenotrophomonas acidaminiphila TaxID=128780 RepID=UPI003D038AE6
MLPGGVLSSIPHPAPFAERVNLRSEPLVDYEMGGIGLQNPNAGLQVKLWTLRSNGQQVTVEADDVPPVLLFERLGPITLVSLAFDQAMNPHVAFVEDGIAWLWWWDTVANAMTFTAIDGARTPRLGLDEKRSALLSIGDVVLAYMNQDNLCVRYQRERFGTEHVMSAGVGQELVSVGASAAGRFQFMLTSPEPQDSVYPPAPSVDAMIFAVVPQDESQAGLPVKMMLDGSIDASFAAAVSAGLSVCECYGVLRNGDYYLFAGNFVKAGVRYCFMSADLSGQQVGFRSVPGAGPVDYVVNTGKGLILTVLVDGKWSIEYCSVSARNGNISGLLNGEEIPWPLKNEDGFFQFSQLSTLYRVRHIPDDKLEETFLRIDRPWIEPPEWFVREGPQKTINETAWQRLADGRAIRGANAGGTSSVVIYTSVGESLSSSFFLPGITTPVQAFALDLSRDWLYFAFASDAVPGPTTTWRVGRLRWSLREIDPVFTFDSEQDEGSPAAGYREILGIDVESATGRLVIRRKYPQPFATATPDDAGNFNAGPTIAVPAGASCYFGYF